MNETPSVKDLQNRLLDELTVQLEQAGFKPRLKQQEYFRESDGVGWVVHVGFIRHRADVDATLDIGVRLTAVEEMLTKAGFEAKGSVTIGAELGNLTDGRPRRWTIRTEAEARQVASEMGAELVKFGLEWLQRFSSLGAVFDALLPNDRSSWLISPLHVKRCLVLVAVGALLRSKTGARALAQECRSFLVARNDPQVAAFDEHIGKMLGGG